MLGLARRTFDGARRQDMDVGLDAHHTYDAIVKRLDVRHLLGRIGREELVAKFHVEVERILVVLAVDSDEVLWRINRELGENCLDLAWEDVDTTDDEHIVGTSQNLAQTHSRTSTLALLINQMGEVACTIANHRHTLFAE